MKLSEEQLAARLLGLQLWGQEAFRSGRSRLELPAGLAQDPELRELLGQRSIEQLRGWMEVLQGWMEVPGAEGAPALLAGLPHLLLRLLRDEGGLLYAPQAQPDWWAALCAELPPALLRQAHPHSGEGCQFAMDPPVRTLVQRGVAENHSHLGSAQRAEEVWDQWMAAIPAEGASAQGELLLGHPLPQLLRAAAVMRSCLGAGLGLRGRLPKGGIWAEVLGWGSAPDAELPDLRELGAEEPLLLRCPERVLQEKLWLRLRQGAEPHCLALPYLRIYSAFWRWLVQPPGVPGLDWFRRSYSRIDHLRQGSDPRRRLRRALELEREGVRLESVEWRTSPSDGLREGLMAAVELQLDTEQLRRPRMGFVLHLPKAARTEEGSSSRGWDHGQWMEGAMGKADALVHLLDELPEALVFLRGLDLCSRELELPLWPAVLPLDRMRQAGREAARRLLEARPGWPRVPSLRTSIHMGEEHRHLQDGLRRVDELVEFELLVMGDRLGHGLCLGEDPAAWCRGRRLVVQPLGERLEDLVWEWALYAEQQAPCSAERLVWLQAQLARHSEQIYQRECTPPLLRRARDLRHDAAFLRRLWEGVGPGEGEAGALAQAWICDPQLIRRRQRSIEVGLSPEEPQVLERLQRAVRRRLAQRHITVECTPSSNLHIGGLARPSAHPIFSISPPGPPAPGEADRLAICINTDNLLVADTHLGWEYQKLWRALLELGSPGEQALAWLERARQAGLDSSFCLEQSRDPQILRWFAQRLCLPIALERP